MVEASDELVHFSRRYEPRPAEHDRYAEGYRRYQSAYERFRTALSATKREE
jgi:sugar (pentulose or hexulose) kinase